MMHRAFGRAVAAWGLVASLASAAWGQSQGPRDGDPQGAANEIDLELVLSHPDWLGNPPEAPYWADDSSSFYYSVKRPGEEARDLVQMDLDGETLRVVADEERGEVDVAGGRFDRERRFKVYSRRGDIYFKDTHSGEIRQLTRTAQPETDPRFLAVGRQVSFRRGGGAGGGRRSGRFGGSSGTIFVRDLDSGLEYQPFDLRLADDPDEEDGKEDGGDYLEEQQERLFVYVREKKERQEEADERDRAEQAADPTRGDLPWYLGEKTEVRRSSLSPTGEWMILAVLPKPPDEGQADQMPHYVNDTGYVTVEEVRTKVGTGDAVGQELLLLERSSHTRTDLDLSLLPGISQDPLEELRAAARARREKAREAQGEDGAGDDEADRAGRAGRAKERDAANESRVQEEGEDEPEARPLRISEIVWSEDGQRAVVQAFSLDNKDRWIAQVDLEAKRLVPLEHFHDPAWINRRFRTLGFLRDNQTLYYLSEEGGYSHLYLRSLTDGSKRALTAGSYVVSRVTLTLDGRHLYFTANRDHPGIYETYRVAVDSGEIEQMTRLGGQNTSLLSPDQRHLLIRHSTTTRPWELYLQPAEPGSSPRQMTRTTSSQFLSLPWIEPQVVAIPSSHVDRPIYARLYTPPGGTSGEKRPAVVFIHGAGYLQNSHQGWSTYFREFMFHTFLVRQGYVVLDMDYRASAGYGRDWRTAIYRQMGTPELEDLEDGVAWLVNNHDVDRRRVGTYGGSYGGFLTLMALFRKPDLFAAGAALRPVTDWAHYNQPYTSNILNHPDIDPEAYEKSSPIEFAEGLKSPLLICHGMLDDNVFFQDTVRLVQRLIELEKENWETAIYPIEPHGFREPTSWLDEYRRIYKLFETHLKPSG